MGLGRNIVVVLAHGLRADALGEAGRWPMATPNLDRLAGQGLATVATSACPADRGGFVCLLTGQHPRQHGYLDSVRHPRVDDAWPTLLREAGYHLAGAGCLGPIEPAMHESVRVADVQTLDDETCTYLAAVREKNLLGAIQQQRRQRLRYGPFEPDRLLLEPEDDVDGFIAAHARKLLRRMPEGQRWALVVALTGPGNDLPPPTLYQGLIDPRTVSGGFAPADLANVNVLAELDYPRVLLQRLEPHQLGRIRADYLARVALLDHMIGRLADALAQRRDRDRTWMLIVSDRGQLLGEHGLVGHRSFLAGAVEVPVILAPPAPPPLELRDGGDALVSTVDIAGTVLDLAGCDQPPGYASRSLLGLLRDPGAAQLGRQTNLSEFGRRTMLETDRHRVVFDSDSQRPLALFDLLNDPDERTNLVQRPEGQNVLDTLRFRLADVLLPLRSSSGAAVCAG